MGLHEDADQDHSAEALPFRAGEVSNGEFVPRPQSARERAIEDATRALADEAARRTGIDRRRFLQSAGGLAAMLSVVNLACSSDSSDSAGTTTTQPGGKFVTPDPVDEAACREVFDGGEFIVDVHTHHVMPDGPWRSNAPDTVDDILRLVPEGCVDDDPLRCLDRRAYVRDLFLGSDTSVAMLTDVPNSGPDDAPVPFADNIGTHEFVEELTGAGPPRALVQSVLAPNFWPLDAYLDEMSAQAEATTLSSFKAYTAWGPDQQGYALDDPAIGLPVVQRAYETGVGVFCAHKGLPLRGFDLANNGPRDMAACAALYPDMQFVIFHSAFEREIAEGPYDPADAQRGTSSVLAALDEYDIPPNANVWCELAATWREVMTAPTAAAHVLGKLLSRVGEDRVLWGTDAIWFGSPQPQIMAFRAFEISPEFQETYGYPALTPELKAKVFGLNAAELLDLDPAAEYCAIGDVELAEAQVAYSSLVDDGTIADPWVARGPITRREMLEWLRRPGATTAPF